jgi:hypothetical protein
MRKIYCVFFLLFIGLTGLKAQSFQLVDAPKVLQVNIGERVILPLTIKNTTDRPLQLMVKRVDRILGTGQVNYFCWDSDCYGSETERIPVSKRIDARSSTDKLKIILETGLNPGFSTVKYQIYDRDNPMDIIEYEVTFTIEERKNADRIFENKAIRLNDVYPNPVKDFAIVDYNLIDRDVKAKVIIHNVLGSIVAEYELPYLENKVKIQTSDYNAGVYFYTLYLDNDGVMTRKLIVRK